MAGRGRDHRGADRVTSSPPLPPHIPGSSVRRDGGSFSRSSFHLDKSPPLCYNTPEAHRKAPLTHPLRARTGGLPPPRLRGRALWYAPRLSRLCLPDARLVWITGRPLCGLASAVSNNAHTPDGCWGGGVAVRFKAPARPAVTGSAKPHHKIQFTARIPLPVKTEDPPC